jgi:glycosyltransferase involved in cell wall biosynthesis
MLSPSVLAVLDYPPQLDYPNGFAPRAHHLLKSLGEQTSLDILALNRDDSHWNSANFLPSGFPVHELFCESLGGNPLYVIGLRGKIRRFIHYLFGARSAMAYPARLPRLTELVAQQHPDLVVLFLPHVAHLSFDIPLQTPCLYVLEEGLERSYSWVAPDMPLWKRRWMDRAERARARKMYRQIKARNAPVIAISDKEVQWFSQFLPENLVKVVPHGIDCEYYTPLASAVESDIDVAVFGGLGQRRTYEPALALFTAMETESSSTREAISWGFIGQNPHESLLAMRSPRVTVSGFVDDVRPYYSRTRVVVVPSQHGGGVKTTVLQAWAMGRPVVATSFALTGLPARHGDNVLVGETTSELVKHVHSLLDSPEQRDRIGRAGRETVLCERNVRILAQDFARICFDAAGAEKHIPHPVK